VGAKASNISIVESLAWIFVSYFSRKPIWFSLKNLRRFRRSLNETYNRILETTDDDYREYSYTKYWLDILLCRLAKDSSFPERKEWNTKPLFTGYLKRIVDKAIHRQKPKDQMLILSLQKGSKKIWSAITEESVLLKKDLEFRARLESLRSSCSEDLQRFIRESSIHVFRPLLEKRMPLSGAIPSNRACWESTAVSGGAQALFHAMELPDNLALPAQYPVQFRKRGTSSKKGSVLITRPVQVDKGYWPVPPKGNAQATVSSLGLLRGLNSSLFSYLNNTFVRAKDMSETWVNTNATEADEQQRIISEHDISLGRSLPALTTNRVARIPEPGGKVRYVSAGSGFAYTALRPLQKGMLKCWKMASESTMRQDNLTEAVCEMDDNIKLPFFKSVDYEAATDLLNRDATYRALFPLLERGVSTVDLAWASFGSGLMIMPDESCFVHVEGQLMGHVLSFPLLCVINRAVLHASVYRWVTEDPHFMEPWGDELMPREKVGPLVLQYAKINGDDMLFKCTVRLNEIFRIVHREVGFKESQGKSYLSRDFCMINSQFYCRQQGKMSRTGYLNLQLVKGYSAKKGDSDATPSEIGASMNKMIDLCPWAQCTIPAALKNAELKLGSLGSNPKHYHIGQSRAWYGDIALGTYGIDMKYAPKNWKPTREQRLLASMMVSDPRLSTYRRNQVPPRTMEMISEFIHPTMVYDHRAFGPRTANGAFLSNHQLLSDDKWFERLLFIAQAAAPPFLGDPVLALLRTFPKDHRLRPMSVRKFQTFKRPQIETALGPECPPLPILVTGKFQPFDSPNRFWTHLTRDNIPLSSGQSCFKLKPKRPARPLLKVLDWNTIQGDPPRDL